MKKIINLILIMLLVISVTGCTKKEQELTDAEKFKEEYESLNNTTREKDGKKIREVSIPEDNPMVYATAEEISKKIDNKESFLVYFGFNDCPWCRSVIEQLISVANDKSIGTIYYVDVKNIRDIKEVTEDGEVETTTEGSKGYNELIEKLADVLNDYTLYDKDENEVSAGEKRIFAPNVVAVSKGKAVQLETGISDKITDPYQKLTKEIKQEAYKKFECVVKCLDNESKTCKKNSC